MSPKALIHHHNCCPICRIISLSTWCFYRNCFPQISLAKGLMSVWNYHKWVFQTGPKTYHHKGCPLRATTWDFQQCGMCTQQRLAYTQSDQSLYQLLEYSTSVKLLTEQHLKFLSLIGGCTGSSESVHVKMPHCWKSHVTAQLCGIMCLSTCFTLNCFNKLDRQTVLSLYVFIHH